MTSSALIHIHTPPPSPSAPTLNRFCARSRFNNNNNIDDTRTRKLLVRYKHSRQIKIYTTTMKHHRIIWSRRLNILFFLCLSHSLLLACVLLLSTFDFFFSSSHVHRFFCFPRPSHSFNTNIWTENTTKANEQSDMRLLLSRDWRGREENLQQIYSTRKKRQKKS